MNVPEKYILLDANLLAGYYAPQTLNKDSAPAGDKIANVIESVRVGCAPHVRLLTPEICVSEVQTVLSKHANRRWKGEPKLEDPQSIHGKSYKSIVKKMRADLHGGRIVESIPLARYHVLAKHLITPVDHNLHLKQRDGKTPLRGMGGTDQLICGMAIWLTKFLGQERLFVFTADYRMHKVLEKARRITGKQAQAWGIVEVARESIGFDWKTDYFPQHIYLPQATDNQLRGVFGTWPLPTKSKAPLKSLREIDTNEIEQLLELYQNMGVGRDRLPYSKQLKQLTKQFNTSTGHSLSEAEVWTHLIARLKQGGGRVKK